MKPENNQHVKCFMRNSTVVEGTVEEWTNEQIVLRSLDGQSFLIVHKPTEDIILTKVVLETSPEEIPEEIPVSEPPPLTDLQRQVRAKLYEVQQPTGDKELDDMNIQELRQLVVEQDRQLIANKRREHFGTMDRPKKTQYSPQTSFIPVKVPNGSTRFYKKQGSQ